MTTEPPAFLAEAAAARPEAAASEDRLLALRAKVAEARDLEATKADLEQRRKDANIALQKLYFKELPDMFDELGIPEIALAPEGNHPGVKAKAKPYYRANIAADWPDEKRKAAFEWLVGNGDGDLIKTEVVTAFPRGAYELAVSYAEQARANGLTVAVKESIPHATLTSWLKESIEKHGVMPPLDTIGGTVGRVVEVKTLKEK